MQWIVPYWQQAEFSYRRNAQGSYLSLTLKAEFATSFQFRVLGYVEPFTKWKFVKMAPKYYILTQKACNGFWT